MLLWRILFVLAIIVFTTTVILLNILKCRKNLYFRDYQTQDFISEKIEGGIKNLFYLTDIETGKYIKRYALRKSRYDKALICNYAKSFKYISFYVICYNKKQKPIDVLEVIEENTNNSSKIINLDKNTDTVNIYIKKAENVEFNTNVIIPISISKIKKFALISSIMLFSLLFMIRHIVIEFLGNKSLPYLESIWNGLGILIILAISIMYFFLAYVLMKKRNCKNRNGGALEYEFF